MSPTAALESRIAGLFLNSLHVEVPSAETDLLATGVLDSMAFVELLVCLERTFGVVISLEDVEIDHFRSIRAIAGFVLHRAGAAADGTGA
jgi:acyl carrier protein